MDIWKIIKISENIQDIVATLPIRYYIYSKFILSEDGIKIILSYL